MAHVHDPAIPTPLLGGLGEDRGRGPPDAEMAVADHHLRCAQRTPLQIPQQCRPALRRFPVSTRSPPGSPSAHPAGRPGDEHCRPLLAGLRIDAVNPEVDDLQVGHGARPPQRTRPATPPSAARSRRPTEAPRLHGKGSRPPCSAAPQPPICSGATRQHRYRAEHSSRAQGERLMEGGRSRNSLSVPPPFPQVRSSRRTRRSILPVAVWGSVSRSSTMRGTL